MARPSGARMPVKQESTPKPIVPLFVVLIELAVGLAPQDAMTRTTAAPQAHLPAARDVRCGPLGLPRSRIPREHSARSLTLSTSDLALPPARPRRGAAR